MNNNNNQQVTTPLPSREGQGGGSLVRLGKHNRLTVLREVDFGVYLDAGEVGDVLLPKRYVPKGTK